MVNQHDSAIKARMPTRPDRPGRDVSKRSDVMIMVKLGQNLDTKLNE